MLELLFFWIAFAVAVGVGAAAKGRYGVGWFLLALIVSPLIAAFLVLVLPSLKEQSAGPRRPCPYCAEPVLYTATLCPHCRSALPPSAAKPKSKTSAAAATLLSGAITGVVIAAVALVAWVIVQGQHGTTESVIEKTTR